MSVSESTITNPKKQLEFYKDLSEQLQKENQQLKEQLTNNSKINIADHKYASSCEDKIIELENKIKQRDEVIEEAIKLNTKVIKAINRGYSKEQFLKYLKEEFNILTKYKGDNK